MSWTLAVALAPAARFRPSDGAMAEFGTLKLATCCFPGMLWNATLTLACQGSGPAKVSFVCAWNGGAILQYRVLGPATPVIVLTRGVPTPPNWMSTGPPDGVSTVPITLQLLNTSCPTFTPPCTSTPWGSRALTPRSTPV